ncbi:uncharacterized protein EHS24_007467 [Apiotrichum porosum]|uniref:Uncharacterized protein n=1 Tax=Apiotrichum porosum TaxID=105984 RepID=A0A427XUG1_9TREE|nr:uncharacterized protein EHS24_007467 [Apiotrichum porosum]RSH82488.1 hypothetical protein EHS24_007467 [Apiotrichum porosum]
MISDEMRWAERGEKYEDDNDTEPQATGSIPNPHNPNQPLLHGSSSLNPNAIPSRGPSSSRRGTPTPNRSRAPSYLAASYDLHGAFADTGLYDHYPILPNGGSSRHPSRRSSYAGSAMSHDTTGTTAHIGNYYPTPPGRARHQSYPYSVSESGPSRAPSPLNPSRAPSPLSQPPLGGQGPNSNHAQQHLQAVRPSGLRHARSIKSLGESRIDRELRNQTRSPSPIPDAPPLLLPHPNMQKFPAHLERSASHRDRSSSVSSVGSGSRSGHGHGDGGHTSRPSVGTNGLLSPPPTAGTRPLSPGPLGSPRR